MVLMVYTRTSKYFQCYCQVWQADSLQYSVTSTCWLFGNNMTNTDHILQSMSAQDELGCSQSEVHWTTPLEEKGPRGYSIQQPNSSNLNCGLHLDPVCHPPLIRKPQWDTPGLVLQVFFNQSHLIFISVFTLLYPYTYTAHTFIHYAHLSYYTHTPTSFHYSVVFLVTADQGPGLKCYVLRFTVLRAY